MTDSRARIVARAHWGKIVVAALVVVLAWELHVAVQDTHWRPSYVLELVARFSKWCWYHVGRAYAVVCEFIRDAIWERLAIVLTRYWKPTSEILLSWLEAGRAVKDYIAEVQLPVGVMYACNCAFIGLGVVAVWWRWDLVQKHVIARLSSIPMPILSIGDAMGAKHDAEMEAMRRHGRIMELERCTNPQAGLWSRDHDGDPRTNPQSS